ncbi:hypothetical protein V6N11_060424 [Hibiscus sabdariffa]|uniref:MADS-box domain-containing protein n=1 Tax=Hibiscus sabdariffa TaxID=183260 RepID=A0ABR2QQA0_9ROSI
MGRVKLQIKRIENTTNRQVTFSKRRNGLMKKAYELSVLCDVDVALLMFSPSGRLSLFSGSKSIEEILERYVNLPEHERGRLRNKELLVKALGRLRDEADQIHTYQAASIPVSSDSQHEEFQQEIVKCKSQIADMQKRLSIFEGEPSEITTLSEAEFHEQILEETLKQVRLRKQVLQENYSSSPGPPPITQVHLPTPEAADVSGFITGSTSSSVLDWIPQKDPQVQILNFLDLNGLLPQRDQCQSVAENILPLQSATLLDGEETMNVGNQLSPTRSGLENDNTLQRPEFGQVIDVNLSPWTELYPTGNEHFPDGQPGGGRALLELYLSQFTQSGMSTMNP